MKLGLITYDAPHLKTEQIALGLAARGYERLAFFGLPFTARKPREVLFEHRPNMAEGAPSRAVAAAIGAEFHVCADAGAIPVDGADVFLITGAGLLPPAFVSETRGRVVNSHPGIIPLVRGLDAFKWAILDQMPIGNTLHYIDEEADAGELIAMVPTPVFATDTLTTFARRHYELEINLMLDFERYISAPTGQNTQAHGARPARMRMPLDRQTLLEGAFEDYKRNFAREGVVA